MSGRFFRSNRPGYPHPVSSELENSGIRVAIGDCSVTERWRWRPPYQTDKTVHVHAKHYKHNEDRRTAPGVCGNGSVPLSHSGNVVTRTGMHTRTVKLKQSSNASKMAGWSCHFTSWWVGDNTCKRLCAPITTEKIVLPRDTDHKTEWKTVLTLIRLLLRSSLIWICIICKDLSFPNKIAAVDNLFFFNLYLSKKIRLEASCESSVYHSFCCRGFTWNNKSYFLWKTMNNIQDCRLLLSYLAP